MYFFKKHKRFLSRLTNFLNFLVLPTLKLNKKPVVHRSGALPTTTKKGIITLTIVISRESKAPGVMPGRFMFTIFKVKTKLQYQMEEYIEWKSQRSSLKKEYLLDFLKKTKRLQLSEITSQEMVAYLQGVNLAYNSMWQALDHTKAIRCLFRYYKARKYSCVDPETIHLNLPNKNANMGNMPTIIEVNRIGRPTDLENIRKVKEMRGQGLKFREIADILRKDVKTVHSWSKK